MKKLMALSAVAFLWGCGGEFEQAAPLNAGAEEPVGQNVQALDSLTGEAWNWNGVYVQATSDGIANISLSAYPTCYPVGRRLWSGVNYTQTASGYTYYQGFHLEGRCPAWQYGTWYSATWRVGSRGSEARVTAASGSTFDYKRNFQY